MIKKLLVPYLLLITSVTTYAQTLKVTAVDATVKTLYDNAAHWYLGKNMVLAIYDNSVSLTLDKEQPIILRATSDNTYSFVESEDATEKHSFTLTVNKTIGVVTSATLVYSISEKVGQHRNASWTITGKRF